MVVLLDSESRGGEEDPQRSASREMARPWPGDIAATDRCTMEQNSANDSWPGIPDLQYRGKEVDSPPFSVKNDGTEPA